MSLDGGVGESDLLSLLRNEERELNSELNTELIRLKKNFKTGRDTFDVQWRKQQLQKLLDVYGTYTDELVDAVCKDMGTTKFVAYALHVKPLPGIVNQILKNLNQWSKPIDTGCPALLAPAKSYIEYQPLGIVMIYGCWNFPVMLLLRPLCDAIAAGCGAVIKPSEVTPNTEKVLMKIMKESLNPKYFLPIEGGAKVASALSKLRFNKFLFTGGHTVAKHIARAAAENLVPCVFELGGKNPVIVDKNCNLKTAAARITWGRYFNSGQICLCPEYVLVHKDVIEEFKKLIVEEIEKQFGKNEREHREGELGRMVNAAGVRRFEEQLENHGGEIIFGGNSDEDSKFCQPTVVVDPNLDSKLMLEECFSPILTILEMSDTEEIINFINDREDPLCIYYFGPPRNNKKLRQIIQYTSSGSFSVNETVVHYGNTCAPFGGVGMSGMGSYGGFYGFKCFSHEKSVLYKPSSDPIGLLNCPWEDKKTLIKFGMKYLINFEQHEITNGFYYAFLTTFVATMGWKAYKNPDFFINSLWNKGEENLGSMGMTLLFGLFTFVVGRKHWLL